MDTLAMAQMDGDAARTVWNGMIDRRPGVIVRCAGAADVQAAVRFARSSGAVLAVRGGSHNIAGSAVCDGGVMIDLTPMKSVRIDPAARTAWVEPGVTLGELCRPSRTRACAGPRTLEPGRTTGPQRPGQLFSAVESISHGSVGRFLKKKRT